MKDPEYPSSPEILSQDELHGLFTATKDEVLGDDRSQHVTPGEEPTELYEGLPVRESPEHFEVTVSLNKLRALLPEAVEKLNLGGDLSLAYMLSYAASQPDGDYVRHGAVVQFIVPKTPGSPSVSETQFVEALPQGSYVSDRIVEVASEVDPNVDDATLDARLFSLADAYALDDDGGYNRMTQDEHKAYSAIIANLGQLIAEPE